MVKKYEIRKVEWKDSENLKTSQAVIGSLTLNVYHFPETEGFKESWSAALWEVNVRNAVRYEANIFNFKSAKKVAETLFKDYIQSTYLTEV